MAIWNRKQPLHRPDRDIQEGEEFEPTAAEINAFSDLIIATSEEISALTSEQQTQEVEDDTSPTYIGHDIEVSEHETTEVERPAAKKTPRRRT